MDMLTLVMAAVLAVLPFGEQHAAVLKETQVAAQNTLSDYQQMVTKENFKRLGFETADEIKQATLGEPMLDYMVQLDDLKNYEAGTDPVKVLKPTNHVIYPVVVRAQTRSSLTLAKTDKGWASVAYGSPALIRSLTTLRASGAASSRLSEGAYFSVRIPAFNLYLLGHRTDTTLMLTPVFDDPKLGLKAGEVAAADGLFQKLKPAAKEHDGLPR